MFGLGKMPKIEAPMHHQSFLEFQHHRYHHDQCVPENFPTHLKQGDKESHDGQHT